MIGFTHFTKAYGSHVAVEQLTLAISPGEVVAMIGPNGSGKTTTLKAAAGLTRPTSGAVLLGNPPQPAAQASARRLISFLPQRVAFPDSLTGREVVEFYRRLRAVPPDRTDAALKFASLNGASNRAVSTYSGGMTQRLGLAVAILPGAPVLLLDEPTAALDPEGLAAFYALIEERKRAGGTVLFTSHHLGDAERLADRFAVLVNGRLATVLTGRELTDRLAERGVMRLRLDSCAPPLLEAIRQVAPNAFWTAGELIVPGPPSIRAEIVRIVNATDCEIRGLTAEEGRLDMFYAELVAASPVTDAATHDVNTKE